jgi:hypothetical protein
MRWFRSKTGAVTWLALFALACQLVLSFGHVHLGKPNAGTAWATNLADIGKTTSHVPPVNAPSPAGTTDDYCAICASISLASILLVPVVLALLAPVLLTAELPWPQADITPATIPHLLFSARGPPHA